MRFFSKKSIILMIFFLFIYLILSKYSKICKKYINTTFGILLISLLVYKTLTEVRENFDIFRLLDFEKEPPEENEFILTIVEKLKKIDPRIENNLPNLKFFEGEKSYTINKKNVYICLKDKNGEIYDHNQLVYVILHELAHTICKEVGHTPKFHEIFNELVQAAANAKLYDPNKPHVENYCEY